MLLYKVYILHYLYLMSGASVMIVENELVSVIIFIHMMALLLQKESRGS